MKKQYFVVLLAVLMMVGLTLFGCAEKAPEVVEAAPTEAPAAAAPAEPADAAAEATAEPEAEKTYETPELVLRFSENDSAGESVHYAENFANMVFERTNGRIKVEVYPAGQLGSFTEVVQATNMGAIDFARCSVTHMSDIGIHDGSLNVFGLPFLYKSDAHVWNVARSDIAQKYIYDVINGNAGANVICLDLVPGPIRNLYTTEKVVTKMEDFKGLKIRVQSNEIYIDFIKALGAIPTPLATSEVYGALQTGVVDGSEAATKAFVNFKYYEVCPYYTYTRHMSDLGMIIVSETLWNKLSAEDQAMLKECALEAEKTFELECAENLTKNNEMLTSFGTQFYEFEEPEKLIEAMAPVYEKYGAGYEALIAEIQAYEG